MINKIFIRIPGSYDINFAIIFIQFLNLAPFPHFHRIAISHMASAAVLFATVISDALYG